jgi:hypothetical protein
MHYEIFGLEPTVVDCLQSHVSSSLRRAEAYIRDVSASSFSWWQVHPYVVDNLKAGWLDEGEEVHYYSYRGKKLRSAPWQPAIKAWQQTPVSDKPNITGGKRR